MFSFFGLIIVYATFYILMPSLMIICAKKQEANPVEVDVTLNSSRTSPMLSIATPVNSATTPTAKEPEKVRPTKSEPKPSPQQAASDAKTNRKKTAPSSAKKTQEESQDPDLYPEIKRLPSKPVNQQDVRKKAKFAFITHFFRKNESRKKKDEETRKKQEALQKIAAEMKTVEQDNAPTQSGIAPTQGSEKETRHSNRSNKRLRTMDTCVEPSTVNPTQTQSQTTTCKISDKEHKTRSGKSFSGKNKKTRTEDYITA